MQRVAFGVATVILCAVAVIYAGGWSSPMTRAQDGTEERIAALETRVAALEAAVRSDGGSGEAPATAEADTAGGRGTRQQPAAVGEQVVRDGRAVTLISVGEPAAGAIFLDPDPGMKYIAFDIRVENVGDDVIECGPHHFSARDTDEGYEFRNTAASISLSDELPTTDELAPGDFVRGTVILEVREESRNLLIFFSPVYFEDEGQLVWEATVE